MTLAWLFEDEPTPATADVLAKTDGASVHVPIHWFVEVGNAVAKGERRRRATPEQSGEFLRWLMSLDLVVDSAGVAAAFAQLLPLARTHDLSVYDAGYLELAIRLGVPLATCDRPLAAAARRIGVPVTA